MNEIYIKKLVNLVKSGSIKIDDIKDLNYKIEVEKLMTELSK